MGFSRRRRGKDGRPRYTAYFTVGGPDYDAVGKSSFGRCKPLLKQTGIYTSTGPGPGYQNLILPLASPLLGRKKVVFAYPRIDQAMVTHFGQLMASGQFTPLIDRRYPPDQIADAYRYVETGQKIGNVVITVDPLASAELAG
jgi:NADPH:quinone reductase-like Zn-dependent oxidoreductase